MAVLLFWRMCFQTVNVIVFWDSHYFQIFKQRVVHWFVELTGKNL